MFMKTYAPKCGFSAWDTPSTPLKMKWDWSKIAVWAGLIVFSLSVWAVVIAACARVI